MPPRIRTPTTLLLRPRRTTTHITTATSCPHCRFASLLASARSSSTPPPGALAAATIARFPPTQPPSHKPAEFRKTQLHRQYQSLLRASPVMLVFQHSNLKAGEWMSIRRELASALQKVDADLLKSNEIAPTDVLADEARIQVVQTGIFASALKVVEFWTPDFEPKTPQQQTSGKAIPAASAASLAAAQTTDVSLVHGLSRNAWEAAKQKNNALRHGLEPLLSGPLALFTLPSVSTAHLAAALSILAPSTEFAAPKRKVRPTYYEPAVQNGLQKLMLLGARIEGKAFDVEGTKWVGSIKGGLDGLRAQLVAALQGVSAGVTNTLEAAGRSLYFTVEGRRGMLEEEAKGPGEGKAEGS